MPASYNMVPPNVWTRELRSASRNAQVVQFYVLTCRNRLSEGLFELSSGLVALETGMDEAEVLDAFNELHRIGLVTYDPDAEVVLDRRALRHNRLLTNGGPVDEHTGKVDPKRTNKALKPAVDKFVQVADTPLKIDAYRLAVKHTPPFAHALAAVLPHLADATDDAPSKGDSRGDGMPLPRGTPSPSQGGSRERSRAEPLRESREGPVQGEVEEPGVPPRTNANSDHPANDIDDERWVAGLPATHTHRQEGR